MPTIMSCRTSLSFASGATAVASATAPIIAASRAGPLVRETRERRNRSWPPTHRSKALNTRACSQSASRIAIAMTPRLKAQSGSHASPKSRNERNSARFRGRQPRWCGRHGFSQRGCTTASRSGPDTVSSFRISLFVDKRLEYSELFSCRDFLRLRPALK